MTGIVEALLSKHSAQLRAASKIYVAYSGGLDSTVLLHAVATTYPDSKISAIHVNHGLSPESKAWQLRCCENCRAMGIEFITLEVHVTNRGKGLEQEARRVRYNVFENQLGSNEVLLMAHHLDDQIETVVYRMLRGSGPKGLAGMPESRSLGMGQLLRPFLSVARSEIENYALFHRLSWVDDESNASTDFDRNHLRHVVIPRLAERWPDYRQRLYRTALQCESASQALSELAQMDLVMVGERRELGGYSIALEKFLLLSRSRQLNVLRTWVSKHGDSQLPHTVADEVIDVLIPAREDSIPKISWSLEEFRRFRNRLYFLSPGGKEPCAGKPRCLPPANIPRDRELSLPDGTTLIPGVESGKNALRVGPNDLLTLKYRSGGERCQPASRSGSATLKKLFNEYGVEPWLRNRIPLIYLNEKLAAVPGLFVCRDFCCSAGEEGISFRWQFPDGQNFSVSN